MKKFLISGSIITMMLLAAGCGDSGSNNSSGTAYAVSGVAVDPYISGAQFCEDVNLNDTCDDGEQLSTLSDTSGRFYFAGAFSGSGRIIAAQKGLHNGHTFQITMRADIDENATAPVVSPMTTLLSRDLNTSAVVEILYGAGITNITEADITADPMAKFSLTDTTITQDDVEALIASISTYTFLRIADGSEQIRSLSGTELYYSAMGLNGHHEVESILYAMRGYIQSGLDPANITTLQSALQAGSDTYENATGTPLPAITMADVVNTSVAIADYLAETGYSACNDAGGNYQAGIDAVATASNNGANLATWAADLGKMYYAYRIRNDIVAAAKDRFPEPLKSAFDCSSGLFAINSSGTAACSE